MQGAKSPCRERTSPLGLFLRCLSDTHAQNRSIRVRETFSFDIDEMLVSAKRSTSSCDNITSQLLAFADYDVC